VDGESGSDPGVMIIADPENPNGPLTVTAVTQGAFGAVVVNPDGSVSYTPNAGFTGTDSFTYVVTDGHGGTTSGTVDVTVRSALAVSTTALSNARVGESYNQTLTAAGGAPPYEWSLAAGQLPAGLTLNANTGAVTGIAGGSGTFAITFQVRDALGNTATATLTIIVGPPVVTTTFLPNGFLGTPYTQQLNVGGNTGEVSWTLNTNSDLRLAWLALSSAGVLSGTPPAYGPLPRSSCRRRIHSGRSRRARCRFSSTRTSTCRRRRSERASCSKGSLRFRSSEDMDCGL